MWFKNCYYILFYSPNYSNAQMISYGGYYYYYYYHRCQINQCTPELLWKVDIFVFLPRKKIDCISVCPFGGHESCAMIPWAQDIFNPKLFNATQPVLVTHTWNNFPLNTILKIKLFIWVQLFFAFFELLNHNMKLKIYVLIICFWHQRIFWYWRTIILLRWTMSEVLLRVKRICLSKAT